MQHLFAYVATAVVFLAIDYVWLTRVARRFYHDRIGPLLLEKPKLAAAAAFYCVFVVGVIIFAVTPAVQQQSAAIAIGYGALFGFFTYATYDMTNYATLKNWSLAVALVDTAWGTVLTAVSSLAGYFAATALG